MLDTTATPSKLALKSRNEKVRLGEYIWSDSSSNTITAVIDAPYTTECFPGIAETIE